MKTPVFKRLKLLHAVLAIGLTLLALKAVGLFHDAQAQEAGASPKPQTTSATAASPKPAPTAATSSADEDDADNVSASEMDVLTSLAKRRAELDAREADLTTRENLLNAAAQRVDAKINQLKNLQAQIQQLLGQRDAAQQKQMEALVKTYSAMKPKDAARIFNTLDDNVRLAVAQAMKPDVLAAILAQMKPEAAQTITVKLAERLALPASENAPSPTPAQAANPPANSLASPGAAATPAQVGEQTAAAPASTQPAPQPQSGVAAATASPPAPAAPAPAQAVSAAAQPSNPAQ